MKHSQHIKNGLRQDIKQLKQKLAQIGPDAPPVEDLQQQIARLEKSLASCQAPLERYQVWTKPDQKASKREREQAQETAIEAAKKTSRTDNPY